MRTRLGILTNMLFCLWVGEVIAVVDLMEIVNSYLKDMR
jgi:hypothetical protein